MSRAKKDISILFFLIASGGFLFFQNAGSEMNEEDYERWRKK